MNHPRLARVSPAIVIAVVGMVLAEPGAAQVAELPRAEPGELAIDQLQGPRVRVIVVEGIVLTPDGASAEGAVIVTSAGGQAVADANGSYRLEVEVPVDATNVQVTALGSRCGNLIASTNLALGGSARTLPVRAEPLQLAHGSSCPPAWLPTFGGEPGMGDQVRALLTFDDGSGPALYAGGYFASAGGVLASSIARWNGSSWAPLGSGTDGEVVALAVYDAGGGPALYAGGTFTTAGGVTVNHVARWDGTSWAALGSGMSAPVGIPPHVDALAVFDDGTGPGLYAGGRFTAAGGVAANHIARWDGASWTALGSGLESGTDIPEVLALAVYDDGGGPALYAGGGFSTAGGGAASHIARWDGSAWAALGSGVSGGPGPLKVRALAAYDDGGESALYAGGVFTVAGGAAASRVARWNGSSWAPLGSGTIGSVLALTVHDDGDGPELFAGGGFFVAGGAEAQHVARWDGATWTPLGSGTGTNLVSALATHDDGNGPALVVGGDFRLAGGKTAHHIARWKEATWSSFGDGLNAGALALAVYDDGSGPALYAGGEFTTAGSSTLNHVARWNGSSWAPLGSGLGGVNPYVNSLLVHDDGSGPALYVGGRFTTAGGSTVNHIARWDGSSWEALGSGMGTLNAAVSALEVYDGGSGPELHAGGAFTTAGGVAANGVARWNGSTWAPLVSGIEWAVLALKAFDDGGGPKLYVGGSFKLAPPISANMIASWNGSSLVALASGMNQYVSALAVYDGGSGPELHAGGAFTTAGGAPATGIARWDGSSWHTLGSGLSGSFPQVATLAVFDDGSGPALHAGGLFSSAGGVAANHIARWNGSSWAPLGSGMIGGVAAMVVHDDGDGPRLFVAGSSIDSGDSFVAKWGSPDSTPPVLSSPSAVYRLDSGSAGEVVHFTVTATDDTDPAPAIDCVPPSGSFFPPGTTLVTCTATDACGNQATGQFPVSVEPPWKRRQVH